METLILVLHVVIALSMVVIIMLQQGKGADAGASFGGGGASGTMFGSLGAMPFLTKLTAVLAVAFFVTSLTLAVLASKGSKEVFTIDVPEAERGVEDIPSVRVNRSVIESDLPMIEDGESQADIIDLPADVMGSEMSDEAGAEGRLLNKAVE